MQSNKDTEATQADGRNWHGEEDNKQEFFQKQDSHLEVGRLEQIMMGE
jgi:hypothetical protein